MNLQDLKATLPHQWRVQEVKEYGATCVAYIDSRDVQDHLDRVVGPENWQSDYKEVKGVVYCGVAIRINNEWVWKWDCGTESNVEKEKGEASDSFKRAAVKWGVGRFLYDLAIVKLKTKQHTNTKWYPVDKSGNILWSGDDITRYANSLQAPAQKSAAAEPAKPALSSALFLKLHERVKSGDKEALSKAKGTYSLTGDQLAELEALAADFATTA